MKQWKTLALALLLGSGLAWSEKASKKSYIAVEVAAVRSHPQDSSEQVTQGLLGDELQLIEERPQWYKVYVKPQYRTDKGYPGWIRKEAVVRQEALPEQEQVVVSVPQVSLREAPESKARVVQKAGLGSQLTLASPKEGDWLKLVIPGQKQPVYAPARHFANPQEVPGGDGRAIVETAAQLKGTPYLWGGMSAKGIDCSGFTYTAYRVHGLTIPRDADQQFQIGDPVELDALQPGDLLFFGEKANAISHVGMYMWQEKFIHSSGSLGGVTVTRVDHPKYKALYQGARRILGSQKLIP